MISSIVNHMNPLLTFPQESQAPGDYPARKKPPETEVQYLNNPLGQSQIVIGQPGKIDTVLNTLRAPLRMLNFTGLDTSRDVTLETIQKIEAYLRRNEMDHVRVSVNLYDPEMEWKRTFANPRTMLITKLFSGTLNALAATIIPKKFQPINIYDQYTDTVSINSNDLGMALFACAQAKATAVRKNPILYNTFKDFMPTATPIGNLNCTLDVLKYLKEYGTFEELEKATKTLCASSGIDFALDVVQNPTLTLGSAVVAYMLYGLPQNESIERQLYGYIKTAAFVGVCAFAGYKYGKHKVAEFKKQLEPTQESAA